MGGGSWTEAAYTTHSTKSRGFARMEDFKAASSQELYRSTGLNEALNPYEVIRECCDSDEHPNTIPVILALDVTGSMGSAAAAVAKQLNDIMESLYKTVTDVEFLIMAIGDFSYDRAPLQASQFESDIRIAEQLEKVYFEGGGGGNRWESYTAAWLFGLQNTKLDCWKRGKKGIIITLGDEPLNPYLPRDAVKRVLGFNAQDDIETPELYEKVIEKFDVHHISIDEPASSYSYHAHQIRETFGELLGDNNHVATCQQLPKMVAEIIAQSAITTKAVPDAIKVEEDGVSW